MIALLAVGCATAPDEIPREELTRWMADVVCDRTRECMRGEFDAMFYGADDCRATLEDLYAPVDDNAELLGCDYDAGRAGAAIDEVDAMTCEEIYEGEYEVAFLDVWEGCAGGPTGPYTSSGSYAF
jgi:hypothetical protein